MVDQSGPVDKDVNKAPGSSLDLTLLITHCFCAASLQPAQVADEPTAAADCGGGCGRLRPSPWLCGPRPVPAVIITNRLMRGLRALAYSNALYWLISHLRHTSSSSPSCASRDAVMRVWRNRVESTRYGAWETPSRSFTSPALQTLSDRC